MPYIKITHKYLIAQDFLHFAQVVTYGHTVLNHLFCYCCVFIFYPPNTYLGRNDSTSQV